MYKIKFHSYNNEINANQSIEVKEYEIWLNFKPKHSLLSLIKPQNLFHHAVYYKQNFIHSM